MHLYERYLQSKDTAHCSFRLIQFFEEGVQFSFFPGDPGEEEETFDDNWTADQEPQCAEIDHWATRIVKTKQVVKVENQIDDAPSSGRSKRAPSIASSRKTFKMRNTQQRTMTSAGGGFGARLGDSEQKSRQGDSVRDKSERKVAIGGNADINNLNLTFKDSMIQNQQPQYQLVPLDVEPPREIPEEEKLLRDRKEKQLKMKELEMKEQREKEERERLRMKNKLDAFAEIEKSDYTYDHNGKIIMVKKPNLQRLPGTQQVQPDIQLHGETIQSTQNKQDKVPIKSRVRLQSGKQQTQKEIKPKLDSRKEESIIQEKAEQELQENYDKLFNQQEQSLKEYGLQKDPLNVQAGIILTDKEGRKTKGPNIPRDNQMTLQEYQKVAQQFEIMNDEKLSKYGSQKKLQNNEVMVSQLDEIQEDEASFEVQGYKRSQERIRKNLGADEVYDREISINEYKINLKAKRKDLKSANVKNVNKKVLEKHNKAARITSAKQQQDVRIRRTPSKLGIKERIFNYENHIGGQDIQSNHFGSQISDIRPSSAYPMHNQSKKNLNIGGNKNQAESLIDEFNKKLLDKGTDQVILPSEMPKARDYLIKKQERPQTSKPIITNKNKITVNQVKDAMGIQQQSIIGGRNSINTGETENVSLFNNKTLLQKKAPRERIISAKLPKENEKLPPPPFGKTMGHGLINNAKK